MSNNIYKGLITALITPFKEDKIDYESLKNLIEIQINAGISGLVIGGSTGEGSSLDEDEYFKLLKQAVNIANKKIYITAGLSSISTSYALKKLKQLNDLEIDGVMCTPPHYIKPEQEGIVEHFKLICSSTKLPIMLYSNPGRLGVDFSDETIVKLADMPGIIALKDAANDIERPLRLTNKLPQDFNMLSGDDSRGVAYSAHGGKGCVSVISNILPKECFLLQNYLSRGDYVNALNQQQKLLPIYNAVFSQSNPIGVKCGANLLKLCSGEIRLPLTAACEKTYAQIEHALKKFGKL